MRFYYNFQYDLKVSQKRTLLTQYASELNMELKNIATKPNKTYPIDSRFKSAIYDENSDLIFSTIKNPKQNLDQIVYSSNEIIQYVKHPQTSYLKATYILIRIQNDEKWEKQILYKMILFGIVAFIIIFIFGYFLSKLFLKPMRDAFHLLDRFIKDTTHELNTPVSTILANIEMIDKIDIDDKKLARKINRIDIVAKTISNIYEDLTYLILNNKIISKNENIDIGKICKQRVEYFATLLKAKDIKIITKLDKKIILNIDKKKLSKLIDNLLSNAIKYNKFKGSITITLTKKSLSIKDTGCGISDENISMIFNRYTRVNKAVGGFGIGLSIVKLICNEYNLNIDVQSKLDKGTNIQICWTT
jgi:two-component system OmpR family sensor kinase